MIAYKTKSYVHLVMIRSAISLWQIVISGMSDACRTWPLIRGPTCGEKDHTVCDRSTKISFCHATWTEKGRPVSHPSQVDAKPSLLKKATSCDLSAFLLMKRCQPPTGRCSFTYIYIYIYITKNGVSTPTFGSASSTFSLPRDAPLRVATPFSLDLWALAATVGRLEVANRKKSVWFDVATAQSCAVELSHDLKQCGSCLVSLSQFVLHLAGSVSFI